jgi:hypothetical protein
LLLHEGEPLLQDVGLHRSVHRLVLFLGLDIIGGGEMDGWMDGWMDDDFS